MAGPVRLGLGLPPYLGRRKTAPVSVAALIIESGPRQGEVLALERGVHLVGRAETCHLRFEDGTISGAHCELRVTEFGVKVRDLGSSNGTLLEGRSVREAELEDGQRLTLGGVILRVAIPPVHIAIPELPQPEPVGPAVLPDGTPACHVHRDEAATFRCSRCGRDFCAACVHRLGLRGGAIRILCPACSHLCDTLALGKTDASGASFGARVLRSIRQAFDFRSPRGGKGGAD